MVVLPAIAQRFSAGNHRTSDNPSPIRDERRKRGSTTPTPRCPLTRRRRLKFDEDHVQGRVADIFRGMGQRLAIEDLAGF
jgi:hypothetical protein